MGAQRYYYYAAQTMPDQLSGCSPLVFTFYSVLLTVSADIDRMCGVVYWLKPTTR